MFTFTAIHFFLRLTAALSLFLFLNILQSAFYLEQLFYIIFFLLTPLHVEYTLVY